MVIEKHHALLPDERRSHRGPQCRGIDFGYGDASDIWTEIEELAISPGESRELIRRHLAELTAS